MCWWQFMNSLKIYNSISILILLFTIISCDGKKSREQEVIAKESLIRRGTKSIKNIYAKKEFANGLDLIEQQEYEKARISFLKADSVEPNNVIIKNAIGNVTGTIESPTNSFKYFEIAMKIDSTNAKTYANYGYWLNRDSLYEDAINLMHYGLRISKADITDSQILYLNLAYSFHQLSQNAKALILLDSASNGPQNAKTSSLIKQARRKIELEEAIQ
jgi:Tfp pilus assembly protein PilF